MQNLGIRGIGHKLHWEKFEWAHANLMKFNQAKCKVQHLYWFHLKHKHRLAEECIDSNPEKDLEGLADEKLNISWECVLAVQKANRVLAASKVWRKG